MHKKKIEVKKVYSTSLITPFSLMGLAFYETRDGKILKLINSSSTIRNSKNEEEEFYEDWLKVLYMNEGKYSPPIVVGKVVLESETQIRVKSGRMVYTFEKSSREEMQKTREYAEFKKRSYVSDSI
jgi:hypothetical protein